MYPIYRDIREKLGDPCWHDSYGVPRYAEFNPWLLDIYDKWVALFLVECQSCGMLFPCARGVWHGSPPRSLALFEDLKTSRGTLKYLIHWGDAPWHTFEGEQDKFDGQCAGTTMTTSVVDVLQLWHRERSDWESVPVEDWMIKEFCEESEHGYERGKEG